MLKGTKGSKNRRGKSSEEVVRGQGTEEVVEITRVVVAEAEGLEDALEDEDVTGDAEHALLLVAVLLSRLVEQLDENRVVEELRGNHKTLHLVAHVDRHVALGDHGRIGRRAAQLGPEGLHPARLAALIRVRPEQAVLRRVGDTGEAANKLLHVYEEEEDGAAAAKQSEREENEERKRKVGDERAWWV